MFQSHQKEQFSLAFVHAVASVAGFEIRKSTIDLDSVDIEIVGTRKAGTVRRAPHLEIQAKCTKIDAALGDAELPFPLKIKNYEDLRDQYVHVPRILVVVIVPENIQDWLHETPEQIALRKCALWFSLRGMPEAENETKKTIYLPRSQRFTIEALQQIMDRIGEGGLP
jgi:hypothetical protein